MVIKIIGAILIMASGTMTGLELSHNYLERIKQLYQIKKMVIMLSGEVKYNNSNIRFAMEKIARNADSFIAEFLQMVMDELGEINEKSIGDIWGACAGEYFDKNSYLNENDIGKIVELGQFLGITDKETQINNFEMYLSLLVPDIEEAEKLKEGKCKLYKTMGAMTGMLISVMII